jgi:hypothetical protein
MSTYKPSEYLNPQKVLAEGSERDLGGTSVKVIIYRISRYMPERDVAPNPLNVDKSEGVERSYDMGYFCEKLYMWLTKKQFDDPTFWNS